MRTTGSQVLFEVPLVPVDGRVPVSRDARRFLMLAPVPGKTLDPEVRVVTDGFCRAASRSLGRGAMIGTDEPEP